MTTVLEDLRKLAGADKTNAAAVRRVAPKVALIGARGKARGKFCATGRCQALRFATSERADESERERVSERANIDEKEGEEDRERE